MAIGVSFFSPTSKPIVNVFISLGYSKQDIIIDDDGKEYKTEEEICSPNYYMGTRMSVIEAIDFYKGEKIARSMQELAKKNPNASICYTQLGLLFIMWGKESMTYDEYIENKNKSKK